jgi:hypothetical protein
MADEALVVGDAEFEAKATRKSEKILGRELFTGVVPAPLKMSWEGRVEA